MEFTFSIYVIIKLYSKNLFILLFVLNFAYNNYQVIIMKKIKKHFLSNADILIFFFSVLFFDYYFRNQLGMSSANAKVIFVNIFTAILLSSFMFLMGQKTRLTYGIVLMSTMALLCFCQNLHYNYFSTSFLFRKLVF